MKIVLATGIYPPDIGGPATYVKAMAEEFIKMEHEVVVITYGEEPSSEFRVPSGAWHIFFVSKKGGPFLRWRRYAKALQEHGRDADIVYAFSSVSCGIPVRMARLKKPRKILRLGGDFLWERYTDRGGKLGLKEWYEKISSWQLAVCNWLLRPFNHVVFSSRFQNDLYEKHYKHLKSHSVIENAVPSGIPVRHEKHDPLRLLFLGRFVRFKNLPTLLDAVASMPRTTLTLAGSGSQQKKLEAMVSEKNLSDRVTLVGDRQDSEKQKLFFEHDLVVLPSLTEISPNVALEARAVGMPVLLTEKHGLSMTLSRGMVQRPMETSADIVAALQSVTEAYDDISKECSIPAVPRPWHAVASDHLRLFQTLR